MKLKTVEVEKSKSPRQDESISSIDEKEEPVEYEEECYWQSYRELTVVGDSQQYGQEVWLAQVTHRRSKRKRIKELIKCFFSENYVRKDK